MAAARWMVRENHIQIRHAPKDSDYQPPDWVTTNVPATLLMLGDEIRVRPKKRSIGLANKHQDEEGEVDVPSHLEWDRQELIGRYNDVCDSNEIGINVCEDFLLYNFLGPEGVRQRHIRWFEGTTIPIPKILQWRAHPTYARKHPQHEEGGGSPPARSPPTSRAVGQDGQHHAQQPLGVRQEGQGVSLACLAVVPQSMHFLVVKPKRWFYLVLLACLSVHRGLLRGSRVFTNPIMNLCQLVRACLVASHAVLAACRRARRDCT